MTRLVAGLAAALLLAARPVLVAADGTAPPPAYRWVAPPAFFAPGNVAPTPSATTIPLGPTGSAPVGVSTPDGQFVVSLGPGAIAARRGEREVAVKVTPLDPGHLSHVASGLRANGNAYRITMTYEPSRVAVGPLRQPGTLVLSVPEVGAHLFTSPDGRRWSSVDAGAIPPRDLSLSATFAAPGYYVAATSLPELVAPGHHSSGDSGVVWVAVGVVAAALVGVGAAFLLVRRRRRLTRRRRRTTAPG